MSDSTSGTYRNPTPTVDIIAEFGEEIVLIYRRNEPKGWALPGGFVDEGEKVEDAALRELQEETGLRGTLSTLLGVYSDPARDPRKHTMSAVYIAAVSAPPAAGDDAAEAQLFSLDALPSPLVFDHQAILEDYARFKRSGERPPPRPSR